VQVLRKAAIISKCGVYRYALERRWDRDRPYLMYVMLNPSTADHQKDDNTIRRCTGFAKAFGYGGILVANLYAYRTPHPAALKDAYRRGTDIIGPWNNKYLLKLAKQADNVVCAWGQLGPISGRAKEVFEMFPRPVYALAFTKKGYPRHPLMLPNSSKMEFYV
jgi:hypothetical protein